MEVRERRERKLDLDSDIFGNSDIFGIFNKTRHNFGLEVQKEKIIT